MRLFIAEKPSVAKAIASELGITGKGDGYITCGSDTVTWCFGHMLEQAEPDNYTPDDVPKNSNGAKIWRVDELPIIPEKWILNKKDDAKKQIKIIDSLIKNASQIINAGDPDREGQLLVDELLIYLGNKNPVLRYWANAIDSTSIKRALANLSENSKYKGLADAAEARGKADWLIGMNLSRAYTLRAQRGGSRALITVGRVQTPTLAMVVNRDREIEGFKPIPFHTIKAEISHNGESFWMRWISKEDQIGLDEEGRLTDTNVANKLVESFKGAMGAISEFKQEPKKKNHPLTFALSDITAIASNKFGYSAEDVLKTCQSLYETHKLTTYPRTDCAYLPESQFKDSKYVLEAIKHVNPDLITIIDGVDLNNKSKTWDDKKVSAHHGIIPTMHKGNKSNLNEMERNIYDLVVRSYLAQFYPIHEYMNTTVNVELNGELFTASGNVVTKNGWKTVFSESDDESSEEEQLLPILKKGEQVICKNAIRNDSKTKAPSRFTEGSLVTAMVNIHKYVVDPQHKKMLREGDGIGTEATRASILSELKRRNYLETKGKHIISTTLGRSIIDALPEVVKSPVLTALYERVLQGIEKGSSSLNDFIQKQENFIKEQVIKANDGAIKIAGGKEAAPISEVFKCLSCGYGLSRRPLPKKPGSYWWGCSNYPACKQTYPDIKGKPNYSKGKN